MFKNKLNFFIVSKLQLYYLCFSLQTCADTVLSGELKGFLFWVVLTPQCITPGPPHQLPPKNISSAMVQTKSKTILLR